MKEDLEKLRLADRAEAILRIDRHALRQAHRRSEEPAVLLTLVSDVGLVVDFMDAYIPELAEAAGLQYVRLIATGLQEVPRHYLSRAFLVLADLTGRDENVITLLYQTFGGGRRILLSAQERQEVPQDLGDVPFVLYSLERGEFDALLREVQSCAAPSQRLLVPEHSR